MNSRTTDRESLCACWSVCVCMLECVCACVHICACMYMYDVLAEIGGREKERRE